MTKLEPLRTIHQFQSGSIGKILAEALDYPEKKPLIVQRAFLRVFILVVVFFGISLGCQSSLVKQKNIHYAKLASLPSNLEFPEKLRDKVSYEQDNGRLVFKGPMSEDERDDLLKLSRNAQYAEAVKTLYQSTQETKGKGTTSQIASSQSGGPVREKVPSGQDTQEPSKTKELAEPIQEGRSKLKISKNEGSGAEFTVQRNISKDKATPEGNDVAGKGKDPIRAVAEEIVSKFEKDFFPKKDKTFNIQVIPFSTLDEKLTMLSKHLAEVLFTRIMESGATDSGLKVYCNPLGSSGSVPNCIDAVITGSLVNMEGEILVNARLVSAMEHIILSATSTSIPASETVLRLFEAEIPTQREEHNDDLNTRLDSLAWQMEQILHNLQETNEGLQKICILDFISLEGKKNLLGQFLAQECALRFSKNQIWRIVPSARVREFLNRDVFTVSDVAAPELAGVVLGKLGIEAIIDGNITDLGYVIKVNARVSDTREGLTRGTASVEIPKDVRVEYLLSKGEETATVPAIPMKVSRKEGASENVSFEEKAETGRGGSKLGEEFFLKEDFSRPQAVNFLPKWGENLTLTVEGEKHFLASDLQEFSRIEKDINFPENFSFEFEAKGASKYWNTLKFIDTSENEFTIDFQLNEDGCIVVLPGPKSIRLKTNTNVTNRFRLVRKKGFYEFYVNDNLALAGPYSKYALFKHFAIVARLDHVRFTGFLGKVIKG